jgi:hypothetical protein
VSEQPGFAIDSARTFCKTPPPNGRSQLQTAELALAQLIAGFERRIVMKCRKYWLLSALVVSLAAGCNSSSSISTPQANSASASASAIPSDPAGQAAYDFLDAVLKGDTKRATNRLTPTAIERINATGKQFSPPGLATASFRIGEVRKPAADQALVQCILTDTSSGAPRSEEIGCLLRYVAGDWRVSGIAYIPAPNQPPMILNFENPEAGAVTAQTPAANAAPAANASAPAKTLDASQARTAQQPAANPSSYR